MSAFVDLGCAEAVAAWLFADFVEVLAEVVMLLDRHVIVEGLIGTAGGERRL